MNFKKIYLLLYKYLRLQNTKFISVFEYILEIAKEFPKVETVTFYHKSGDNFITSNILGESKNKDLSQEKEALNKLEFVYIDYRKKYIFSHNIGDIKAKTDYLKTKSPYNKIIIPIYIEQKDDDAIKIGVITFCGNNLTLEKTKLRIINIRDTMIFLATVFSSISQMMYNRFDKLTSLITRKEFEFELKEIIMKKLETISIIMIDIDYFKKINDNYGHDAGDLVLRQISQRILSRIRTTSRSNNARDLAIRWGGEEFVIILPNTNLETANIIAKRIKENIISKKCYISNELEINVNCSFGISNLIHLKQTVKQIDKKTVERLISLADEALYESKKNGRNTITIYGEQDKQRKLNIK